MTVSARCMPGALSFRRAAPALPLRVAALPLASPTNPSTCSPRASCPQLAIARGLAYAPYADLIWCETSTPDMEEAREFAGERA